MLEIYFNLPIKQLFAARLGQDFLSQLAAEDFTGHRFGQGFPEDDQASSLTPRARILIAPYGTRIARPDDKYVRQLEQMDVDIIAYQDEVGVRKSKVDETPAFYEGLKKAHARVPRVAIWADVEIFEFAGKVYESALLPAPFQRVRRQLEAVSPFVDTTLVYQYQGMMNKPDSVAFAGPQESTQLYSDYEEWLRKTHPTMLKGN